MIEITNLSDSRIQAYANLKKSKDLANYFIAENEKVVQRLLQSNLNVRSVLGTTEAIHRNLDFIQSKKIPEENIYVATKDFLEKIVGFSIHRGIMAEAEIPVNLPLSELGNPIVILNRIYDSENIGSIIRTATAFGIKDLIFDKESSHPYLRRSVRVSMGNIFGMRIHESESLLVTCLQLRENGFTLLGGSANFSHANNVSAYEINYPKSWALILGNEAEGISEALENSCDTLIHLPMAESVDSLNVSHSLAALLALWKSRF